MKRLKHDQAEPTAIVLAAGRGERFGGLKQLEELYGATILERVLRTVGKQDWHYSPLLVLGHGEKKIKEALDLDGFRVISNDNPDVGLSSSLKAGVRKTRPGTGGYIFFLGDMPLISKETVNSVLNTARAGASIAAPFYEEERGFPVYLSRSWKKDLLEAEGDRGARKIIAANRERVTRIPTGDRGTVMDINRPADVDEARQYLEKED